MISAGDSGGAGNDWFRVRASSSSNTAGEAKVFSVVKNGTQIIETLVRKFSTSQAIIVNGNGGNDTIEVMGKLTRGVRFYGGQGNDALLGGDAGDMLIGNNGLDVLTGLLGRDLLLGGKGVDRLFGGKASGNTDKKDENILAGDASTLDTNDGALTSLLGEWSSLRSSSSPANASPRRQPADHAQRRLHRRRRSRSALRHRRPHLVLGSHAADRQAQRQALGRLAELRTRRGRRVFFAHHRSTCTDFGRKRIPTPSRLIRRFVSAAAKPPGPASD